MKELSIEDKAKAYDGNYKAYTELINRLEDVKNAIKKQNYGIAVDILYKPYPEFQITTSTELKEDGKSKTVKQQAEYLWPDNDELSCKQANAYCMGGNHVIWEISCACMNGITAKQKYKSVLNKIKELKGE